MWEKIKSFVSNNFLLIAIGVGILPISVAIYAYYNHFNQSLGYGISGNQSDWGTFGDFVGGLTNPIYAFFAFVGVSFALILQRDQNEMVRQHKKQDEIQSMIQNVSATLHTALFDTKVKLKTATDDEMHSVFMYLRAISNVSLRAEIDPNGPDAMIYKDELATVLGKIGYDLTFIQEQLEIISCCLRLYSSCGGSQEIVDIYKTKYRQPAFMIYQIGYLHLQDVIDFFEVKNVKCSIIQVIKQEQSVESH